jgi:hypothetical protein
MMFQALMDLAVWVILLKNTDFSADFSGVRLPVFVSFQRFEQKRCGCQRTGKKSVQI